MIQTRSERNGIKEFATFKEALDSAKNDLTIWKISFALSNGERIRLVRDSTESFRLEQMEDALKTSADVY